MYRGSPRKLLASQPPRDSGDRLVNDGDPGHGRLLWHQLTGGMAQQVDLLSFAFSSGLVYSRLQFLQVPPAATSPLAACQLGAELQDMCRLHL